MEPTTPTPTHSGRCTFGAFSAETEGKPKDILYSSYLGLEKILTAQNLRSTQEGQPEHDEMLFIITHQTYELWFKQILHDLDLVLRLFSPSYIPERSLSQVERCLRRIVEILRLLVHQVKIMETMLPLDFLRFRDFLGTASGFQSLQFRLLENKLGVQPELRLLYQRKEYCTYFAPDEQHQLQKYDEREVPSLLKLVERWLERTPFVDTEDFDFWSLYRNAVYSNLDNQRTLIQQNTFLDEKQKQAQLANIETQTKSFETLFDDKMHQELLEKGDRRLSIQATKAALLIYLYHDEPMLHMPFVVLSLLTEIDSLMSSWRFTHSDMVQKMIGVKVGTGGSSGYHYLRATVTDRYKVFLDLNRLATYFIHPRMLPPLPTNLKKRLQFFHSAEIETK